MQGIGAIESEVVQLAIVYPEQFVAAARIAREYVVAVLERYRPSPQPFWLAYPQRRHMTSQIRASVDFMVAQFAKRVRRQSNLD